MLVYMHIYFDQINTLLNFLFCQQQIEFSTEKRNALNGSYFKWKRLGFYKISHKNSFNIVKFQYWFHLTRCLLSIKSLDRVTSKNLIFEKYQVYLLCPQDFKEYINLTDRFFCIFLYFWCQEITTTLITL